MFVYQPTLERQFSEPHAWWDEYDARREEQYRELIKGKTCLDCGKCRICERTPTIGYCVEDGEFRYDTDNVEQAGYECFRGAA